MESMGEIDVQLDENNQSQPCADDAEIEKKDDAAAEIETKDDVPAEIKKKDDVPAEIEKEGDVPAEIEKKDDAAAEIEEKVEESKLETIEILKAAIAEVKAALAAREAEQAARMAALAAREAECYCRGFIVTKGLPELPRGRYTSYSSAPSPPDYSRAVQRQDGSPFAVLAEDFDLHVISQLWRWTDKGVLMRNFHCTSAANSCKLVLQELAVAMREQIVVVSRFSLSLAQHERQAETVLLKSDGRLVGFMEFRKPSFNRNGAADLLTDAISRQMANHLQVMREAHGCCCPFGIVSTYNHWAIAWLDSAVLLAAATGPASSLKGRQLRAGCSEGESEPLYFSPVYSRDDPQLPLVLASALLKMIHGEKESLTAVRRIRGQQQAPGRFGRVECGRDGETQWVWSSLPKDVALSYEPPLDSSESFYFLQDFRGDLDGRVWLCCDAEGRLCVVKLLKKQNGKQEGKIWGEVWKVRVRLTRMLGCPALIMPLAFHGIKLDHKVIFRPLRCWCGVDDASSISLRDFTESEVEEQINAVDLERWFNDPRGAAREAIEQLALAGYVHEDIHWRHVALLPEKEGDGWTVRPILIDLTSVVPLPAGLTVEKAVAKALEILDDELSYKSDECRFDPSM